MPLQKQSCSDHSIFNGESVDCLSASRQAPSKRGSDLEIFPDKNHAHSLIKLTDSDYWRCAVHVLVVVLGGAFETSPLNSVVDDGTAAYLTACLQPH